MQENYAVFKLVHDVMTVKPKHRLPTEWGKHKDYILALKNLEMGQHLGQLHSKGVKSLLISNGFHLCNNKK